MNQGIGMKNTIRFRLGNEQNGTQTFKALISHPMETGRRRDGRTGELVPADYIEALTISVDGGRLIAFTLGENVSRNPFVSFTFTRPIVNNQVIRIDWSENSGHQVYYESVIAFDSNNVFIFSSEEQGTVIPQLLPQAGSACKTKNPPYAQ